MLPQLVTSGSSAASAATHTTAPTTCCREHLTTILKTAAITAAIAAVVFATYTLSSVFLPYPILATTAICASLALIVLVVMKCRSRISTVPTAPPFLPASVQNLTTTVSHVASSSKPSSASEHARNASTDAVQAELKKKLVNTGLQSKSGTEKLDVSQLQARIDQLEKTLQNNLTTQLDVFGKQLQPKFEQLEKLLSTLQENDGFPPLLVPSASINFDSLQHSMDALAKKVESRFSELQHQITAVSDQLKTKGPSQEKLPKSALPPGHVRVFSSMDAESMPSLATVVIPVAPALLEENEESDGKESPLADGLKTPPPKPFLGRRKSEPSPQFKQEATSQHISHDDALKAKAEQSAFERKTKWVSPLSKKAADKKSGYITGLPANPYQAALTQAAFNRRQALKSPPASPADQPSGSAAGKASVKKHLPMKDSVDWSDGDETGTGT